jgi:UDPglucose 6-dehydrogenase
MARGHASVLAVQVCVVGLGKLGLPLATCLSAAGHDVVGADLRSSVVEQVNSGVLAQLGTTRDSTDREAWERANNSGIPVNEPGLRELLGAYPFKATTDIAGAAELSEVAFVVVPTPSSPDDRFDPSAVAAAAHAVGRGFARGTHDYPVLVIVSTVMPGHTDHVIAPTLKAAGLRIGETVGLVYSPEFIALGSVVSDLHTPAQVLVGASDDRAAAVAMECYRQLHRRAQHLTTFQRLTIREAEVAKMAVNAYLCTKISFANALGAVCAREGADPAAVARVVGADPRIGLAYLGPGAPYGGPCLGRDARAFATLGAPSLMGDVRGVNEALHDWLYATVRALAQPADHPPTVGILGVAFKPGTPVVDDSAGSVLAAGLRAAGVPVVVHDPLASTPMDAARAERIEQATWCKVVAVCTPHPEYRHLSPQRGQTFVDLWGITKLGDGTTLRSWQTPR